MQATATIRTALWSTLIAFAIALGGALSAHAASITLRWDHNDPNIAGYTVYYGNQSRIYPQSLAVGNTKQYTFTNLEGGKVYFFAVTASNAAGQESEYSNEVDIELPLLPQDPVDDPVDNPVDDPADDPVDDPVDDPADDPVDDPVDEPADDPIGGGGSIGGGGPGFGMPTFAHIECFTDADCDDGSLCNGLETCVDNRCIEGEPPCEAHEYCDDLSDRCVPETTPAGCLTDADCDDGIFCNGAETCSAGICLPGSPPCGDDQLCIEEQGQCYEMVVISSATVVNKTRRPVVLEKRCQWLILKHEKPVHLDPGMTSIMLAGEEPDFHGVEVDESRDIFVLGRYIFVPVCIARDASPGRWHILIESFEYSAQQAARYEIIQASVTVQ